MALPNSNGKIVLITGINGYIASVLGLHLLKKGYSIRGTSRKTSSVQPLLDGPYSQYRERVTLYEVLDITVLGAFDEAVKGVHGIFHTASPINFSLTTYEETVLPAYRGVEILLQSALKAGSELSSVVVTSSTVAVVNPKEESEYEFTEKDFATFALEKAEKEKDVGGTPSSILYAASKTAAERAVWKFRDEVKPTFSISTINPVVVIGPPIVLPSSPGSLNETLRPLFSIFSGSSPTLPQSIGTGSFVDVRDVADMHIWAYEHPKESDGERFIACQGFGPTQAIADILRYEYKGEEKERIVKGEPGVGYNGYNKETGEVAEVRWLEGRMRVNGKKAERVMGIKYISFQKSVVDTAKVLEALI